MAAEPGVEVPAILKIVQDGFGGEADGFPPGVEPPADPYQIVAESDLWPPMKLELLARAAQGGIATEDELMTLAGSLLLEDDVEEARDLIDILREKTPPGVDPLGRTAPGQGPDLIASLHEEIQTNVGHGGLGGNGVAGKGRLDRFFQRLAGCHNSRLIGRFARFNQLRVESLS